MLRFYRLLKLPLVFILLALALALAGCSAISSEDGPAAPADEQVALATEAPMEEPTATAQPTAVIEPTATEEPEPTATEEPEPTEVALGPPPAFSEDLHATAPQTVALGAGHPQLLEFFAFW